MKPDCTSNSGFIRLGQGLANSIAVATVAGLVWLSPVQAAPIVLGVVRSPDNQSEWQGISSRLQSAKVDYRVVDWLQVDGAEDLHGLTVLFLPNVKTLTPQQVIAVETWMSQGGRVIASGEVGRQSSSGVQQALRSLLGAYWESTLSQPNRLQSIGTDAQAWSQQPQAASPFSGGVLMPTGTGSRTIAVWQPLPQPATPQGDFPTPSALPTKVTNPVISSPAGVVATDRSIFLGWQWGGNPGNSAEFDHGWLNAALQQYGSNTQSSAQQSGAPLPAAQTLMLATTKTTAPSPATGTLATSITIAEATPTQSAPTSPQGATATPAAASPSPTPAATSGSVPAAPASIPPASTAPASPSTARPAAIDVDPDDPTHQSLFPPIRMTINSRPITHAEAVKMSRELDHLAGRVESALISVSAANVPIDLTFRPGDTAATIASASGLQGLEAATPTELSPVWQSEAMRSVNQTREFLKVFPQMVSRRDYANARRQWLQHQQRLLRNYPIDQPLVHPEIRAIWLDRGTIVRAGSEAGLTVIFDRLAAAGINTVFLETVNAGYPIFPSQVAPQQNPQLQGWDALASAVKLAHQRGMQLHAWVWVFAVGNERHNKLLGLPANYPGPVLAAHPEWANYDNRGRLAPVGQPKPFLDPANPEVRQYLLALFQEIVTRYPVDGLQLDYIRYPFQEPTDNRTYGYGRASRQAFQQLTGVDPLLLSPLDPDRTTSASSADIALRTEFQKLTGIDPVNINPNGTASIELTAENAQGKNTTPAVLTERELWQQWTAFRIRRNRELWKQWTEFRTEQVNSFVAEAATSLRQARPNLVLSAAVFPMPERVRLVKIQQHWEVWVKRGDLDLLVPMTYATDTNRFQQLTAPLLELGNPRATFVLPGIRLLNLPAALAVDQIQTLRDSSFEGYSLFAAQDLNDAYHSLFSRTQGLLARCTLQRVECAETVPTALPPALKPDLIPYRQPFQTAHSRYLTLKREWSFLLSQRQLQISEAALGTMRIQAEVLERALSRLATNPSRQTLNQATQELRTFRQQFATWMQPHAKAHPYQMQVWENRLTTIETLLRYGDRTMERTVGR